MTPEQLAKALRNIGPVVSRQMVEAGIDTPEKLRTLGAKEAFLRIYKTCGLGCGNFHAAYLYALEGAIHDCDWRLIPDSKKEEFKAFTEKMRQLNSGPPLPLLARQGRRPKRVNTID
jgi:DNA transformation protein